MRGRRLELSQVCSSRVDSGSCCSRRRSLCGSGAMVCGLVFSLLGASVVGTSLSIFALSSLIPIPSLLSSVLFRLRPVMLCTTHTGCLLITTVVLRTIETGARTDLPDPNVFRSRLPALLSSSLSVTSLVLLVPTDMWSRVVVLCTTQQIFQIRSSCATERDAVHPQRRCLGGSENARKVKRVRGDGYSRSRPRKSVFPGTRACILWLPGTF